MRIGDGIQRSLIVTLNKGGKMEREGRGDRVSCATGMHNNFCGTVEALAYFRKSGLIVRAHKCFFLCCIICVVLSQQAPIPLLRTTGAHRSAYTAPNWSPDVYPIYPFLSTIYNAVLSL